jgi:hypothetical protein
MLLTMSKMKELDENLFMRAGITNLNIFPPYLIVSQLLLKMRYYLKYSDYFLTILS